MHTTQTSPATSVGVIDAPSLIRYDTALHATMSWLRRSVEHGRGGSCATYGIWGTWSRPYPETTGYLIPTLLDYAGRTGEAREKTIAVLLGAWLLDIQDDAGFWHGGTHPPKRPAASIFNTAQILLGLAALYRETGEARWLDAATRGAEWLARGVGDAGAWRAGNYKGGFNPSYYTRVAWPMLEIWRLTGDTHIRSAAERVLNAILARRRSNGAFGDWGFEPQIPAFTHTIAYTLRGFLESARLLENWEAYGAPVETALDYLYRQAELNRGRLAGAYGEDWSKAARFTCLTGNAQVAICLLKYEARAPDLRLVNAASKLVDTVCASQYLRHPVAGIRGAVAGSRPLFGSYMAFRYPNWAAKFHCDALMLLTDRLTREYA